MLDTSLLRKELERIAGLLKTRGFSLDIKKFEYLDNCRKNIQQETEMLQSKRNYLAKQVGRLKAKGLDVEDLISESQAIPAALKNLEHKLSSLSDDINDFLYAIPNIPHSSVPIGLDSTNNIEIRRWFPEGMSINSEPKPFDFVPKDHVTLGESIGLDLDLASRMSGSRFLFMKGKIALLHRALSQFMLDLHTKNHGYEECYTPYIVNASTLFGTGQLPKFKEDMFAVKQGGLKHIEPLENDKFNEEQQYLISTSEITLVSSVSGSIVSVDSLPIKLTAHTPCFRSEAGSGGRDVRGLIRQHQFDKVELVQIVHPDSSYEALEIVLSHAERTLQLLSIPYRVMSLCSGDIGFCSAKTYDLEVWLPSQNNWREISSVSNCEAFQARRMKARFRDKNGNINYLHTINGSGLAIGRALVAVLENNQQSDGSIVIPIVLRPYMDGMEVIIPS
ncbi:seryl-tRNA synthetase [Candidatus Kinetoplastibacterium oncopeltii TCC290E]|uniref:Serine--tRNA ligase n=1 Tax=Candidatus Kinetoplastidibacterium stringomonadis TCC290E TaxID=1208920 RepID=M1L7C8_9PROT|nr:serine--tRNA ligase [Candidatus Kinetoplastibacterium oncopeltii]AGF48503.1 seryl-tRNA synthetase [Candidatus Kinetoplastibacterium oncopeltii TCC290E]